MIENNKYSWENINIKQFKLIETILKEKTYDDNRDLEKYIELLSVVLDKPYEYFDAMPVQEFNRLRNEVLSFLKEEINIDVEFDTNTIKKTQYNLNGKKYNVTLNPNQMVTGQYIDFLMFFDNNSNDFVNLLSTILIPDGFKYNEYDINEVKKDIENYLPITKALGLCFFFQKESEALIKVLKFSSIKKLRKQIKILKKEMKKEKNPDKKELIANSIDLIEQQMLGWIQ